MSNRLSSSDPSPIRILITSVGSLVGQNLLDVLDHPGFRRRSLVTLIGTNSVATSPGNFRCDRCHLVPDTASAAFSTVLEAIVASERPELILCGRDEDTVVVRDLLDAHPGLGARLPHGSRDSLLVGLDKRRTAEFCLRHGLPFARTGFSEAGVEAVERLAAECGYPLIAKPARGFASKGVYYARNAPELRALCALDGYIFQEYLGDPAELEGYFRALELAPPLFAHAPNVFHHSAHSFVYPDGTVDDVFISRNAHNAGVTVGFERVEQEALRGIMLRFAAALHAEGGFGPMTVQFRQDRHGAWKAMEINLRTNGNTYPRFLLGQDDLGLILNAVLPGRSFPKYVPQLDALKLRVSKSPGVSVLSKAVIDRLQRHKIVDGRDTGAPEQ